MFGYQLRRPTEGYGPENSMNQYPQQTRFSHTRFLEASSAVCSDPRPCLPLSAAPGCSSDGGRCPRSLRPPWLRGRLFPAGSRWLSSRPCPGLRGNRRRFYGSGQRRLLSPLWQQKERTPWRGISRSQMNTAMVLWRLQQSTRGCIKAEADLLSSTEWTPVYCRLDQLLQAATVDLIFLKWNYIVFVYWTNHAQFSFRVFFIPFAHNFFKMCCCAAFECAFLSACY